MAGTTSRRRFLATTGAAALSIGGGVPLLRALAGGRAGAAEEVEGPRWAMVVDPGRCARERGCRACIDACHAAHNVPRIDDPEEKVEWIWKEAYGRVFPGREHEYLAERVRGREVPVLCNHCDDPPCVRVCPTGATWKREDGVVMMDMHRCIGCRYCLVGCPYGSRSFNWRDPRPYLETIDADFPTRSKGVVEKCSFCSEKGRSSADGTWTPECVAACPEGALVWGDVRDPDSEVRRILATRFTIRRREGLGTRPHVFYAV